MINNANHEELPHSTLHTQEGASFARLLSQAKFTPASLAKELGVSVHVVYGWNKRGVSTRSALAVARLLKCKPQEISRIESSSDTSLDFGHMRGRGRTAPVIGWEQCKKRIAAMADSQEYAAFMLADDIDADFCYALKAPHAPGVSVSTDTGLSIVLIVDPRVGGYTDTKSRWGFIVDINQGLPVYRQIEDVGADRYLVSADDRYPAQAMLFFEDHHKILGVVIALGLAMA